MRLRLGAPSIAPSAESQFENWIFVESQTRKMQIFGVYTPIFAENRRFLGLVESQIAYFVRKRPNCGISKRNFEKFSKVGGKRFYDFKKSTTRARTNRETENAEQSAQAQGPGPGPI